MGLYEDKGCVRYTMILSKESKDRLKQLAKTYKITHGEALEVILASDLSFLDKEFKAARENKVGSGPRVKTAGLTPEQVAELQAIADKMKSSQ